jgi:glycosyltransferase involved in cell wall biosynthesis
MKIIHISTSDSGGAGRAALRIHKSLVNISINSELWTNISNSNEKKIKSPKGNFKKIIAFMRRYARLPFIKLLNTKNPVLHSPAVLPSNWVRKINESDADLVNLHWVQHEMLSISDISKITKPLIWTLHDMWAFCGAEHISLDDRWINGYLKNNRPLHESGFDINRWTWLRKLNYWKKPIHIVTPSAWLSECVKKSKLMHNWPTKTIPNAIDTEFWKSINKKEARHFFNLPKDHFILAFGSSNANQELHKGFDLLLEALQKIQQENLVKIQLIIFGQKKPQKKISLDIPVHNIGYLNDVNLKKLYNAANAVVIPSRTESFGQIACEASACETPVVSFDTGGLRDIIKHHTTGYLAKGFNTDDLSHGIKWVLENAEIKKLGYNGRRHVVNNFDCNLVAKKYIEIYNKVIKYQIFNKNIF